VPGVVYGREDRQSVSIAVDPRALSRILHSDSGMNTLITLKLDKDAPARVLIKECQLDPIRRELLHVDFYRVAMDRAVTVTVPIVLKGEPAGVKQQGGLLDFVHRDVEIECLPGEIPEHLQADVSELMIGQAIRLRDLLTGVQWKPVSDPEMLIAHVIAPKAEEEAAAPAEPAAAPEAAEPEVIKKGKVETTEEPAE
jgi:large subunit ribosomal protein L25